MLLYGPTEHYSCPGGYLRVHKAGNSSE